MEPTSEQLETIQKVIERIAPRYKFSFYEIEDIKQEAYMICLEAIEKYDTSRPFENFIAKHLSNRLKTFRRNRYFRQNVEQRENSSHFELNEAKKNLMDLKSFSNIADSDSGRLSYETDFEERLSTEEALQKIMDNLSPQLRNDFLRLANGVNLKFYKKDILFRKIKEILGEDW